MAKPATAMDEYRPMPVDGLCTAPVRDAFFEHITDGSHPCWCKPTMEEIYCCKKRCRIVSRIIVHHNGEDA